MFLKKEKYRQIIFLALVISGTIIFYTTNAFKKDESYIQGSVNENIANVIKNNIDARKLSGVFINKPDSQEGIDALFSLIVFWDKSGNDSSINSVMNTFEKRVKDDSLKNKFYCKIGRYFLSVNMKQNTNSVKRILQKSFSSVNDTESPRSIGH